MASSPYGLHATLVGSVSPQYVDSLASRMCTAESRATLMLQSKLGTGSGPA